jgi:hypothetical protein
MMVTKENLESDVRAFQALLECNDEALTGKSDTHFKYEIEVRSLALRGLATMPRPIEEAPRDGTVILLITGELVTQGAWHEGVWVVSVPPYSAEDFHNLMPWLSAGPLRFEPTHFAPLSALAMIQEGLNNE